MGHCIIHPIPLWVGCSDKSKMTNWFNQGIPYFVTGYIWYIEGTSERIIVDAGGDVDYLRKIRGHDIGVIQDLETGLKRYDLNPQDIDLVISTHLHNDHIGGVSRFSKAKVLVQKDELEFARNPHPMYDTVFCKEFLEESKFEIVHGDTQITDDVSILKTPGHTPGGQSVCIKTEKGTAIIAGLCTIKENYEPPPARGTNMRVIPPMISTNLFEAYDSELRILDLADTIIPLHDSSYWQNKINSIT